MQQHYPTQFGSHASSNPLQQQLLGSKAAAAAANMMTVPASNSAPNPMSLQAMLQQRAMIGQPVFGMGTMYTSQQLHMGQYQAPYSYAGPQQQQLMQYGSGAGPYQTSAPQVRQGLPPLVVFMCTASPKGHQHIVSLLKKHLNEPQHT